MGGVELMVVLDTHVWLWWLHDPSKLSEPAHSLIEAMQAKGGLLISSISIWEVAVKVQIGKLAIPMDIHSWFEMAKQYPGCTFEHLTPQDAIASTQLPGDFHKDPADRIIISLARRHGIPLITCDQKILDYPHVETFW